MKEENPQKCVALINFNVANTSFNKHWNLHMILFNCKTLIISCFCCLVVCNNTSLCKVNRDNILHNQEQMANIIQRVLFTHLYNTLFLFYFLCYISALLSKTVILECENHFKPVANK